MQKSAQYQAVLEILEEVLQDKRPADLIVNEYIRARKYIGSKDRKAISDTVWGIIRNRMKLEFDCKNNNARNLLLTYLKNEDLELLCGVAEYGLTALTKEERNMLENLSEEQYPDYVEAEMPQWLYEKINNDTLCRSLNEPATADFRINNIERDEAIKRLQKEGLYFAKTPYSPLGLRSSERVNINNCIMYREGNIEIQDEASQIAAILCDVSPKHKIIDYCAGAGGKSLAMAVLLDGKGTIFAHDINKARLMPLKERMDRLHIKNITVKDKVEDIDFDRFIIDAPCSGSGTFRRSPDAKFRLTEEKLKQIEQAQKEVLDFAYNHTKSGGEIVYITCSVLQTENQNRIEEFLACHNDCKLVNLKNRWQNKISEYFPFDNEYMLSFSPLNTNTDGFFVSVICKERT